MKVVPVIFLAFANDRVDNTAYLRNLPQELDGIRTALYEAQKAGLCEVVERANVTVEQLLDVFQDSRYRDRIAVMHYGGHANGYQLLLEALSGEHSSAYSDGLVSFLAKQRALKLIFLNGCSSQQQAQDLVQAGLPAVIGTSQSINDDVATQLALRFYQGIGQGLTLSRSWLEAIDQVKIKTGTANMRDLYWEGVEDKGMSLDRFPWDIYYRDGAELVKEWNLPDEAGNPLFNLPTIPNTHNLPESPFLFLKRYEREHARVFFGRSYYIRDLYNKVTADNSPPIILLYGQSGVGKSSLFDAGLNPRLERTHNICYVRRDDTKGLSKGLESALEWSKYATKVMQKPAKEKTAEESAEENAEEKHAEEHTAQINDPFWVEKQTVQGFIVDLEKRLEASNSNVKEGIESLLTRLRRELSLMEQVDTVTATLHESIEPESELHSLTGLLKQWKTIEARTGKPLLIILDQVEEMFTRPIASLPNELEDLLDLLDTIFKDPAISPVGSIILGYRKEYNPEIEEAFKRHALPRSRVFLETLSKKDIVEILQSLSTLPDLKLRYNLIIEKELPYIIADDLLEDKNSPVAPVLQILLTKMWDRAMALDASAPTFTVAMYQALKKEGILLDDFFFQQLAKLKIWSEEAETSGLALDVLFFHTTHLGTAGSRGLEDLRARYQHRQDIIEKLIDQLKELYLINTIGPNTTGLAHDTIAPLIQREFRYSERPGQRASRVLENKLIELDADSNTYLDLDDLELVEEGQKGMRYWVAREADLVAESQKRKARFIESRKRLKRLSVATIITILAIGLFGIVQWSVSKKLLGDLAIQRLEYRSRALVGVNPTLAIGMAKRYYDLKRNETEVQAQAANTLKFVLSHSLTEATYQTYIQENDLLGHVSISPDGLHLAAVLPDNGTSKLWTIEGKELGLLEGSFEKILAAHFVSNDRILIVFEGGRTKLLNLEGKELEKNQQESLNGGAQWSSADQSMHIIAAPPEKDGALGLRQFVNFNKGLFLPYQKQNNVNFPVDWEELFNSNTIMAVNEWGTGMILHDPNSLYAYKNLTTGIEHKLAATYDFQGFAFIPQEHDDGKSKIVGLTAQGEFAILDHTGLVLSLFDTKTADLGMLTVSPDGHSVAAYNSQLSSIQIWDMQGKLLHNLQESGGCNQMGFSANGRYCFKRNNAGHIVVWDLHIPVTESEDTEDKWLHFFTQALERQAQFGAGTNYIVAVGEKDSLQVIDWIGGHRSNMRMKAADSLHCVLFRKGQVIQVYGTDGKLLRLSTKGDTMQTTPFDSLSYFPSFQQAALSPDGRLLALATGYEAMIWNLETDSLVNVVTQPANEVGDVQAIDITDSGLLAIVRIAGYIELLDATQDNRLNVGFAPDFSLAKGTPNEIALSPDGRQLALSTGTSVSLWNSNGSFIESYPTDLQEIKDIRFTATGKRLLVCTKKGVYSWYMLNNLIAQLNASTIQGYTLDKQVEKELSEFGGRIIYTFTDTIFLRKALIFFYLIFIGVTFIHGLVDDYDNDLFLRLAYNAIAYGFLLLMPIAFFEVVHARADIIQMANGSMISLMPIFLYFIRQQVLSFKAQGKKFWLWMHWVMGAAGTLAFFAFVVADLLSFLNYAMLAMTVIIAILIFSVRVPAYYAIKSWYRDSKWKFYAWSFVYAMVLLITTLTVLTMLVE